MLLELEDIERARARIDGRVHVTPMMSSTTLGDELGVRLHLKAELFQKTGSFVRHARKREGLRCR